MSIIPAVKIPREPPSEQIEQALWQTKVEPQLALHGQGPESIHLPRFS